MRLVTAEDSYFKAVPDVFDCFIFNCEEASSFWKRARLSDIKPEGLSVPYKAFDLYGQATVDTTIRYISPSTALAAPANPLLLGEHSCQNASLWIVETYCTLHRRVFLPTDPFFLHDPS